MVDAARLERDDPFAAIRAQFMTRLEAEADVIDALLVRLEGQEAGVDLEALGQIRTIAHKISGVAATLGFEDLGDAAAQVDIHIVGEHYLTEANSTVTKELVALFLQELDLALENGPKL